LLRLEVAKLFFVRKIAIEQEIGDLSYSALPTSSSIR